MTENAEPTQPILDRFQLETPEDIERHNERNHHQIAANAAADRRRRQRAAVARQRLSATQRGQRLIATTEAIRTGTPDAETVNLAQQIADMERAAEKLCEEFLLDATQAWPALAGLHMTLPFSQELQRIAVEARNRLAGAYTVNVKGGMPQAITINPDERNPLNSVVVYSTSRPAMRWVLGRSDTFADLVTELKTDVHCDFAAEPYARKLLPHKSVGKPDCIGELAEDAARWRSLHNYWEQQLKSVSPDHRGSLARPGPLSVGVLFPIAFSDEIVVLKFCHGHALAFLAKYGIQPRECGIEEPWESVGNYW